MPKVNRADYKLEGDVWRDIVQPATKPYGGHWQRIESGLTGGGIPDINCCHSEIEAWIELKRVEPGGTGIKFQPLQIGWHLKRHVCGGRSFILAFWEDQNVFIMWPGFMVRAVRDLGVKAPGGWRVAREDLTDLFAIVFRPKAKIPPAKARSRRA